MELERVVELLEIEKECVGRNIRCECNRDCYNCDIVQEDYELDEMYSKVIDLLKNYPKIVRCENCKFGREPVTKYSEKYVFCMKHSKLRKLDMFCSEGLEKEVSK